MSTGAWQPGDLVATDARTIRTSLGPCRVCGWAMLAGDRVCDLASGGTVHVSGCVTAAARTRA